MSALRSLRQFYNEVLQEPIPDPFLRMLASLSDGSGAAVAQSGLTELASDIRHSDRTSREIHAAHDAQSHNLNATLSTRSASDGSDA